MVGKSDEATPVQTEKETLKRFEQAMTGHLFSMSSTPSAPVAPLSYDLIRKVPVDEDLKKRKEEQELSQQDKRFEAEMEQRKIDRELKKAIATLVFRFLAVETFALFLVVLLQGFSPFHFHLEDSTINIFLGATLLQISSMAVIITRHLYPTSS